MEHVLLFHPKLLLALLMILVLKQINKKGGISLKVNYHVQTIPKAHWKITIHSAREYTNFQINSGLRHI